MNPAKAWYNLLEKNKSRAVGCISVNKHTDTQHRCKKTFFYVFLLKFKKDIFYVFFCFFNVVFLLLLKQKRTKLQI